MFDAYEQVRDEALAACGVRPVEEAAAKIRREETYHLMHSRGWVLRLGDATEESHRRMQAALDALWPHALGLFEPASPQPLLPASLQDTWLASVSPLLARAGLSLPQGARPLTGGRQGRHSEHLPQLLAELQKVARSEDERVVW